MIDLQGFGLQLLMGATMTVEIALGACVLGLILGLGCAAMRLSGIAPLVAVAKTYTTIIRGIPELLVVLLVYFGSARVLTGIAESLGYDEYVELSPFVAGVIALGLTFGAYASEVFRGAFLAVPQGQIEAARALGMSPAHAFRRILLPQVWRIALPGLGNLFLVLLKDTSLVSVAGMEELMRKTSIAVSFTKEPFTFYAVATVMYLGMTVICTLALHIMERRANLGYRPLTTV